MSAGTKQATRTAFGRLVAIIVELAKPEGASAPDLSRRWEVSRKTIQRDLDFVRDQLMLEAEYDPSRWRWHLRDASKAEAIQNVFLNVI